MKDKIMKDKEMIIEFARRQMSYDADLNKEFGLVVQLRSRSGKIVFETR